MNTPRNNQEANNDEIIESEPTFRSVSLVKPAAIGLNPQHALRSYSKSSKSLYTERGNKELAMSSSSSSNSYSQPKARWVVRVARSIPLFGLERGAVEIGVVATIVAARVDDSLRKRSVEVQFDNDNAEAICTTSTFLEYKICLYASDDQASTHIELIRIHGCAFAFRKEREAVINAANGLGAAVVHTRGPPKTFTIPADLKRSYQPPTQSDLESTIHRACDNFHSSNPRNVLFPLENLAALTNADRAHTDTAHRMSELIMSNESNVRDLILAIYSAQDKNSGDHTYDRISHSCLTILINGLKYLDTSKSSTGFLDTTYEEFVQKLIPHLTEDIKECGCNTRTNNACLALECLQLILKNSSLACKSAEQYNLRDVVMHAEKYGSREYFNLERVAKSTIEMLTVN